MAEGIESLKKNRRVFRGAFTRNFNETEKLFSTETPDISEIQVNFDMLVLKFEQLRVIDNDLYESLLESASEEELQAEMESCDTYIKKYFAVKLKFDKLMESRAEGHSTNAGSDHGSHQQQPSEYTGMRRFNLPKIEFIKYDGAIKDWLPFWNQFKKIHEDECIADSDKIEYLIQATVPGSRARRLVESFPIIGANYPKIIECMESRFGREDLQIEVYIRELLKLILTNSSSKQKMDMASLYDKIETQLRSLETLGVASDKCSAMLYPLIESCLPQELLRVWQRSSHFNIVSESDDKIITLDDRLKKLLLFLRSEVENEQRIDLAKEGFGLVDSSVDRSSSSNTSSKGENLCFKNEFKKSVKEKGFGAPTAIGLMNAEIANCVFCSGQHESKSCFKAQKMSNDQKREILTKKKACFRCFKIGHQVNRCRSRLRCIVCQRSHEALLCPELSQHQKNNILDRNQNQTPPLPVESKKNQDLSNQTSTHVFLQTLQVTLKGSSGLKKVRVLVDSGSQRSYILKETALQLGYLPKHSEKLIHCLFGGKESAESHVCYDVTIVNDSFLFTFEALDQMVICGDVSPVFFGEWSKELSTHNIVLSDNKEPGPIEVLLGADVIPSLYTGIHHKLTCGLVAIETSFGWTLTGKIPVSHVKSDVVMTSLNLFVKNASVSDLWELDVLGIQEPSDKCTREESAMAAKELFMDTISRDEHGRYEVRLPWLEGHAHVPTNFNIAKKRLDATVHKLKNENLFDRYNDIFVEWETEGIIERVSTTGNVHGHFLPHRPVIKESSTTQIRPVFDASAHEKDKPSLNCCLEKGLNLIELIPSVLLRFRENKLGVVSDIRRAFLQISVSTSDRNFLKFLWIDSQGQMVVYRHKRVVFGLSSSPFLLGATLEYHLSQSLKKCEDGLTTYSHDTVKRLARSFYVDNCVTSLPDEALMKTFIKEATDIMKEGCFDLRGWENTRSLGMRDEIVNSVCPVLGLNWLPEEDNLTLNASFLRDESLLNEDVVITKRYILSLAHKVFDPIGYLSPTILVPKLMLQKLWKEAITWDQPVDDAIAQTFKQWVKELPLLQQIKIPRWICAGKDDADELSIHTFCDASQDAYSCVIFLRVSKNKHVSIHLLAAKARVAPMKKQGSKMTIPRMELLAATIGARLYEQVVKNLENKCQSYFWSDSTTVISWIQRKEEWGVFVWNRVSEIRDLTSAENWRHLPGVNNPADLPSRGCSPKQLLSSRWWEGPTWLYHDPENWPLASLTCDEEEIMVERKKKLITTALKMDITDIWHLEHFSKYIKTVRMFGWIFRFIYNCKHPEGKIKDELNATELHQGETFLLKLIQKQSFSGVEDNRLKSLNPFLDEEGLIRLKSRVSNREDKENYRFPIILPSKHFLVYNLIMDCHIKSCHVGTQGLLCLLREKFWILCGRRTVRSVVTKCVTCKRFHSKPMDVVSPPLPLDRVRDAIAFEVTGVDFAGPLYLKDGCKAWICLFTCAVYRAVHLELVTSLSTVSFLQALRRFVARRGRPKTIFSDNGTNFVGAENAFSLLDWKTITRDTAVQRISWKFNPPTAAWWGGFWERLIGVVKQLLKKVLGRASLNYEDLLTVLCDCESIVNSRPLTYVSEDPKDLVPLSPEMFLRDRSECGMPDCDLVDRNSLCRKARKIQTLREVLRSRFRAEYLGQLSLANNKVSHRQIALGELVLVGNDNSKRLEWPVGRVVELLPGKDGQIRLVRIETSRGVLLRPLQRLYPMEIFTVPDPVPESQSKDAPELLTSDEVLQPDVDEDREPSEMEDQVKDISVPVPRPTVTRCGRVTKVPERFL